MLFFESVLTVLVNGIESAYLEVVYELGCSVETLATLLHFNFESAT